MKVGDKVRVKSITEEYNSCIPDMRKTIGKVYEIARIKSINGLVPFGLKVPGAQGEDDLFWYAESDLELVTDRPKVVGILTEKVMVKGVKCRRILGFEGVLRDVELPKKYVTGCPSFWLYTGHKDGAHVFDGSKMRWSNPVGSNQGLIMNLPSGTEIDVGCFMFTGMNIGDVWPEPTFQKLLTWLKRACYRLAEIRREERNAWQGEELLEI